MLQVKSPQDLGAGLAFMLIGLAGLYFGSDLAFGSSSRMGPGYFPTLLSALIIVVGLVIGAGAIIMNDTKPKEVYMPERAKLFHKSSDEIDL